MTPSEWRECCEACAKVCDELWVEAREKEMFYEPWGQNACIGTYNMWRHRAYGFLLATRAISALGERGLERADPIICGRSDGADECADEVENIDPSTIEVTSSWISAEDSLPDRQVLVLAWDGFGCFEAYIDECGSWRSELGGDVVEVTHWMPLPPLPEGKE